MSRVFDPWIGDCYTKGINNVKTLIVGESHHGGEGCHYGSFTTETIKNEALGLHGHRKRAYFTKIMRIVMGVGYPADDASRVSFWNSIAFYNFVQVALEKPRQRPTDPEWETAITPLRGPVNELNPSYIVILGLELLQWMPKDLPCPSRATMHPSAPGFSYGEWPDLISNDLSKIKS